MQIRCENFGNTKNKSERSNAIKSHLQFGSEIENITSVYATQATHRQGNECTVIHEANLSKIVQF